MKPEYNASGQAQRAQRWYEGLDYTDKRSVDKKINHYISYVKGKSRTPASPTMGVELVYAILTKGMNR